MYSSKTDLISGKPGLMRWIIGGNTPQMQDLSTYWSAVHKTSTMLRLPPPKPTEPPHPFYQWITWHISLFILFFFFVFSPQTLHSVCESTGTDHVVDVGAGQGHLSRLLAYGYGLHVTTIEAADSHAPKAVKFDQLVFRRFIYFWKELFIIDIKLFLHSTLYSSLTF